MIMKLKKIFLVLSLVLIASLQNLGAQPNIVLFFADDWGRYAGIYDEIDGANGVNSIIKTPTLDKLGTEGVVFTNAHVPSPSCTPCRSSLLSGMYFFNTGMAGILSGEWSPELPSFPIILRDNGYHIGFSYKVWHPGSPEDAPIEGSKYMYQVAGTRYTNFSGKVLNMNIEIEDAKAKVFEEAAKNIHAFFSSWDGEKPFFYWFGPANTHRAWAYGSAQKLWNIDPDDLEGKMPKAWVDNEIVRQDFADYLGEVMVLDHYMSMLVDTLEARGVLDNTLFLISGDHGIPGFPRAKTNLYEISTRVALIAWQKNVIPGGRSVTDYVNIMDICPTVLEAAGIPETDYPDGMDARSFYDVLLSHKSGRVDKSRDFVLTGRERHVPEAREGNLPYPQRALITDDYYYIRNFKPEREPVGMFPYNGLVDIDGGPTKRWYIDNLDNPDYRVYIDLCFGKRPFEELYSIKDDYDQLVNLANKPEYRKVLLEMRARMDSILLDQKDPRVTDPVNDCRFDKLPYTKVK